VARARAGQGPGLLEAVTFRHRGHVGPKEDVDVGVRRQESDIVKWKRLDPIARLRRTLLESGRLDAAQVQTIAATIQGQVDAAALRAEAAEYPPRSALLDLVYVGAAK
jgi:TPP-dependent pyruvate/acetoin dehydrogenase alpha subunit